MKCVVIKFLLVSALAVVVVVGTNPSSSFAQEGEVGTTEGAPMGKIYLSASDAGYVSNSRVDPFVPFHVYVLVELDYGDIGRPELNGEIGMLGYEFAVDVPGLGADVVITGSVFRNEVLNVSTITDPLVGIWPPLVASAQPQWIVDYTMVVMNAANVSDQMITVGANSRSSFQGTQPGFAEDTDVGECVRRFDGSPAKCIRPFAVLGNLSLNCKNRCIDEQSVAVEPTTWSRVKANFEG